MRYFKPGLKLIAPFAVIALAGCHGHVLNAPFSGVGGASIADLNGGGAAEDSEKPKGRRATAEESSNIARVTAELLERRHYLRDPDHKVISERMFTLYLKALDPLHYYLLQSDIDEFTKAKDGLFDKLLDNGDTSLATVISNRYMQRFDESVAYVNELLKSEKFTFEGNETLELDRKTAPAPKTLEEARLLWRTRLRYEYLQEKLGKTKPEDIIKTLTKRYARISRNVHEMDSDDVLERYLNALAHAYDPHSDYFGKAMMDRFNDEMNLSLVGIGASLQADDDGYCKIMGLLPGGPAIKSGKLAVGDRIVAVAQASGDPVDVVEMKTDKIVSLIRGKKGTEVRLTVIPAGAERSTRKVVTLVRDEVKLEEKEATAEIIDTPNQEGKQTRLGYVNLPSFYSDFSDNSSQRKSTTADVAKLVTRLQKENIKGLILDLRNNGGGSLEEVINLTGLFAKSPPVVQVKMSNGNTRVLRAPNVPVLYSGPMIVLCNRYSASASEILAGALQDYGRAIIVGDSSTFGKGTVQTVEPLGPIMDQIGVKLNTNPGELKYTIEKFFRPSGSSTQLRGVASDIIVPSTTGVVNEYSEQMLDYAMNWDTLPTSKFEKFPAIVAAIPKLRKASAARIATDPDFAALQKVIDEEKRVLTQKTITLNEAQRAKEKAEQDARMAAVKKVLQARKNTKEKVYKFTLKLAAQPGMPPLFDPTKEKKSAADATDEPADPVAASAASVDTTLTESERILLDLIAIPGTQVAGR